ncbi:MAG: hypothetical protein ACPGUV_14375, partial [Polyangiales bacterium]
RGEQPSAATIDDARRAEKALRLTNWVSTGLWAGTAAAGILDAQLRFVPVEQDVRPRQVPQELLGWHRHMTPTLMLRGRW